MCSHKFLKKQIVGEQECDQKFRVELWDGRVRLVEGLKVEEGREPVTPDGWISIKRSFYDELLANQRDVEPLYGASTPFGEKLRDESFRDGLRARLVANLSEVEGWDPGYIADRCLAALAAERGTAPAPDEGLREAVLAERRACAEIADDCKDAIYGPHGREFVQSDAAAEIARLIRERE